MTTPRSLIDAIERGMLARAAARDPSFPDRDRVLRTCRAIATHSADDQRAVVSALRGAGIGARAVDVAPAVQRHEFVVAIAREDGPAAAGAVIDRLGYRRHPDWRRGADRSFWATTHEVALTRSDEATIVARLRWDTPPPAGWSTRAFRPTAADWATTELPTWAWRGYALVRPIRLAVERITGRHDRGALEPFLATPTSLVEPLLDLAELTAEDVFADIGCGDGRLVVTAAQRYGCRAIGFEYDLDLVLAARRRAAASKVADLVEIVHGDGMVGPLERVTVAMLFVPTMVAARLVPQLLRRLPSGSRIVVHEQNRLDPSLPAPDLSLPIVTDDAVTIARLWRVDPAAIG